MVDDRSAPASTRARARAVSSVLRATLFSSVLSALLDGGLPCDGVGLVAALAALRLTDPSERYETTDEAIDAQDLPPLRYILFIFSAAARAAAAADVDSPMICAAPRSVFLDVGESWSRRAPDRRPLLRPAPGSS